MSINHWDKLKFITFQRIQQVTHDNSKIISSEAAQLTSRTLPSSGAHAVGVA